LVELAAAAPSPPPVPAAFALSGLVAPPASAAKARLEALKAQVFRKVWPSSRFSRVCRYFSTNVGAERMFLDAKGIPSCVRLEMWNNSLCPPFDSSKENAYAKAK
jgi:hypothetical protein